MVERNNQTIMCSVFFLGILEYSRKSVSEQILLKERFNSFLSTAIHGVPVADRIILDTSDGVAINFLGDVEDALKTALNLEESLRQQEQDTNQTLFVRMGINLGPVRLVMEPNGQPNIVGDGINVARSIMGFSDASQILVSRSYYDAITRLSPHYGGMFHYLGSRTDNNVREHEIYALVHTDEKSMLGGTGSLEANNQLENQFDRFVNRAQTELQSAATRLNVMMENLALSFWQLEPQQRAVYVGAAVIFSVLFIVLAVKMFYHEEHRFIPIKIDKQPITLPKNPASIESRAPGQPISSGKEKDSNRSKATASSNPKTVENKKNIKRKHESGTAQQPQISRAENQTKQKVHESAIEKSAGVTSSTGSSKAYISISCKEGTEIFVEGVRKGRVGSSSLTLPISPGKHSVIVSHPKAGIFPQEITIEAGKTVKLNPGFCN